MFKLRMEVADVVQAEYEATDAQKALLKEAWGGGTAMPTGQEYCCTGSPAGWPFSAGMTNEAPLSRRLASSVVAPAVWAVATRSSSRSHCRTFLGIHVLRRCGPSSGLSLPTISSKVACRRAAHISFDLSFRPFVSVFFTHFRRAWQSVQPPRRVFPSDDHYWGGVRLC